MPTYSIAKEFKEGRLAPDSEMDALKGIGPLYKERYEAAGITTVAEFGLFFEAESKAYVQKVLTGITQNARANRCIPARRGGGTLHLRDVNFMAYKHSLSLLRYIRTHPAVARPGTALRRLDLNVPRAPRKTTKAAQRCGCLSTQVACDAGSATNGGCTWTGDMCAPKGNNGFHGRAGRAGQRIPAAGAGADAAPPARTQYGMVTRSRTRALARWRKPSDQGLRMKRVSTLV